MKMMHQQQRSQRQQPTTSSRQLAGTASTLPSPKRSGTASPAASVLGKRKGRSNTKSAGASRRPSYASMQLDRASLAEDDAASSDSSADDLGSSDEEDEEDRTSQAIDTPHTSNPSNSSAVSDGGDTGMLPSPPQTTAKADPDAPFPDTPPFPCRWGACTETFATLDALNDHLALTHVGGGRPEYYCEWTGCARASQGEEGVFKQRQKLQRHLQMHINFRPFQCEQCGARFSESSGLQLHMRTHSGEKPFACEHPGCGKRFATTGSLANHVRVHNGEKPFECPICHRRFAEASNLSKHKRTHTGAKPHICDQCGRSYARSDQLTRHLKLHAKQEESQGKRGPKSTKVSA